MHGIPCSAAGCTSHRHNEPVLLSYTKGTTTASYTYNGAALRMSATTAAGTKTYTWNTESPLPQLLDDGTLTFIYGPTGPLEQVNNTTKVNYFLSDQHGSTRVLTDSTGATVGTYKYDAYGNATHTGTASTPLTYSGQVVDPTTGYQYVRARDYDPSTGQFLTVDPLVDVTYTPYAYVNNNPINGWDPSGDDSLGGLLGAAIVATGAAIVFVAKPALKVAGQAARATLTATNNAVDSLVRDVKHALTPGKHNAGATTAGSEGRGAAGQGIALSRGGGKKDQVPWGSADSPQEANGHFKPAAKEVLRRAKDAEDAGGISEEAAQKLAEDAAAAHLGGHGVEDPHEGAQGYWSDKRHLLINGIHILVIPTVAAASPPPAPKPPSSRGSGSNRAF
jgi:RHS repeat-associated protein